MSLYSELKRRNVLRVAIAYLAASWLIIQVVETLFPIFGLSDAFVRLIVILLTIGFPAAVIFSWLYELTPEGLKLEKDVDRSRSIVHHTGRKLDRSIIVILTLALSYFAFDKFILEPARDAMREETVAMQARRDALVERYGDKSIAVLPFVNMSADTEQEYFSDGVSEELLNLLAKISELRVISRSSAFSYKGKDIDIPTVAEQLNVGHVLEGSVRKSGNRVRITAQLIEARSDTHLWSETYDRTLDDIFATQTDIATRVVEELKLRLLENESLHIRETDPRAYALYLQAKYLRLQNNPEAYENSIKLYQQALDIDPQYPPALEGLAEAYVYQGIVGARPVAEVAPLAREAIDRAIAADPNFSDAISGLGWMAILYDHDLQAAARHFERALEVDPTNLDTIEAAAYLADAIGDRDTAVELLEYGVSRDPAGPVGHFELGLAYLKLGRIDDAEASLRTAIGLHPKHFGAWQVLGLVLTEKGQHQAALEAMQQESIDFFRLSGLAIVHYEMGQLQESDKYLAELVDKHAAQAAAEVASVYAWRSEHDKAFEWLERARANKESILANVANHYSLRNLHDDPRWQQFLATMGQSHDQLSVIEFNPRLPE